MRLCFSARRPSNAGHNMYAHQGHSTRGPLLLVVFLIMSTTALTLFATPPAAYADRAGFSDPRDADGLLDIRRVEHGHAVLGDSPQRLLTHRGVTHEPWQRRSWKLRYLV